MFKKVKNLRMITLGLLVIFAVLPLYSCSAQQGVANQKPSVGTPGTSVATSGTSVPTPAQHFANQGLYESCSPTKGTVCLNRLQQMAAGGFTLVVNYNQLDGTAGEELTYAQKAHELGMKIIWDMDAPIIRQQGNLLQEYSTLASTCQCSDDSGFISYYVNLVKDLPATWGYYIGDEVPHRDLSELQAFSDYVKQLDPSHPRLIVQGSMSAQSAQANLAPFANAADVLGADFYPVGDDSVSINTTGAIAQVVQTIANQNHKQSAMVLQAFSWTEYPNESGRCSPYPPCANYPTESQMRRMFDLAINNSHPAIILWYSYYDILDSSNPAQNWNNLIKASNV